MEIDFDKLVIGTTMSGRTCDFDFMKKDKEQERINESNLKKDYE